MAAQGYTFFQNILWIMTAACMHDSRDNTFLHKAFCESQQQRACMGAGDSTHLPPPEHSVDHDSSLLHDSAGITPLFAPEHL
jgi:hypothetical protein